jgi:hypothetical protein
MVNPVAVPKISRMLRFAKFPGGAAAACRSSRLRSAQLLRGPSSFMAIAIGGDEKQDLQQCSSGMMSFDPCRPRSFTSTTAATVANQQRSRSAGGDSDFNVNANDSSSSLWKWEYQEPQRTIAVPPQVMYQVVANVNDYSQFVPYCTRSHILRHSPHYAFDLQNEKGLAHMFDAVLTVGLFTNNQAKENNKNADTFKPQETYVSRVTLSHAIPEKKEDGTTSNMNISDTDDETDTLGPWTVHAQSIQTSGKLLRSVSSLWTIEHDASSNNNHDDNPSCVVNFQVEMNLANKYDEEERPMTMAIRQVQEANRMTDTLLFHPRYHY